MNFFILQIAISMQSFEFFNCSSREFLQTVIEMNVELLLANYSFKLSTFLYHACLVDVSMIHDMMSSRLEKCIYIVHFNVTF